MSQEVPSIASSTLALVLTELNFAAPIEIAWLRLGSACYPCYILTLNPFTNNKILDWSKLKQIADDIVMFSTLYVTYFSLKCRLHFKMLSAICFNVNQSKILSSGNDLSAYVQV